MHSSGLDDISDRSDDELYVPSGTSQLLRSGYYRIETVSGVPLGRGKLSEYDPSLVVTLPRDSAAPKWFIRRRDSGKYDVIIDNLPVYFEQMALRINRENEEDRGIEWDIEPCAGHMGVYKIRNATIGAYRGFDDVWIAPNVSHQADYVRQPQVRVGDIDEVSESSVLFRMLPA